jgi:hypothetical protein
MQEKLTLLFDGHEGRSYGRKDKDKRGHGAGPYMVADEFAPKFKGTARIAISGYNQGEVNSSLSDRCHLI